jgi:ABC-type sugar transport system ATPase subunit
MNLLPAEVHEEGGQIRLAFENSSIGLAEGSRHLLRRISDKRALMGIRPEHIGMEEGNRSRILSGRIQNVEPLGREVIYHVQTQRNRLLVLSAEETYNMGQTVGLSFRRERIHLFDPDADDRKTL